MNSVLVQGFQGEEIRISEDREVFKGFSGKCRENGRNLLPSEYHFLTAPVILEW